MKESIESASEKAGKGDPREGAGKLRNALNIGLAAGGVAMGAMGGSVEAADAQLPEWKKAETAETSKESSAEFAKEARTRSEAFTKLATRVQAMHSKVMTAEGAKLCAESLDDLVVIADTNLGLKEARHQTQFDDDVYHTWLDRAAEISSDLQEKFQVGMSTKEQARLKDINAQLLQRKIVRTSQTLRDTNSMNSGTTSTNTWTLPKGLGAQKRTPEQEKELRKKGGKIVRTPTYGPGGK